MEKMPKGGDEKFMKGMSKKGKMAFEKADDKADMKLAKKIKEKPGDKAKRAKKR